MNGISDPRCRLNQDDSREGRAGFPVTASETKEVMVGGNDRAAEVGGSCELLLVGSMKETLVRGGDDVDATTPQPGDDASVDALVGKQAKGHGSGLCRSFGAAQPTRIAVSQG